MASFLTLFCVVLLLFTALQAFGTVDLHMGKRLDSGSAIFQAAMSRYNTQCGVELNLSPANCYHPACTRGNDLTAFTYPTEFYAGTSTASLFSRGNDDNREGFWSRLSDSENR